MKRLLTIMFMALVAISMLPVTAEARIKSLLKNVRTAAETVVAAPDTDRPADDNPLADVADIQLLYASGDTVSADCGRIMLVVSVNMKANSSQIRIGSVNNTPMMAVTPDGTVYKPELNLNGVYPKEVVGGTSATIPLDDTDMIINDIPLGTPAFQTVTLGVMVDPRHKETLTFHNVPINGSITPFLTNNNVYHETNVPGSHALRTGSLPRLLRRQLNNVVRLIRQYHLSSAKV